MQRFPFSPSELAGWLLRPLPRSQWLAISLAASAIFLTLLGTWWKRQRDPGLPLSPPVVLEIRGDVLHPGFVSLDAPVTPMQAAATAGCSCGPLPRDPTTSHQQVVATGQRLLVTCYGPGPPQIEITDMDASARLTLGLKLDLNTATASDLALLPGMQPRWAETIVARRGQKPWQNLGELQEVAGIGPQTVGKWTNYLQVHQSAD